MNTYISITLYIKTLSDVKKAYHVTDGSALREPSTPPDTTHPQFQAGI